MLELFAVIIFFISLCGIFFILGRKVPVLVKLPQNGHHGIKKPEVIVALHKKLKEKHFHFFEKQMLLHSLLSKFRVWILKAERYIDSLLQTIRKKAQELDKQISKKK